MAVSPIPMYTAFLGSIGCDVDAEDKIGFVMPDGSVTPITLEGKRLVMPTPEMLRRIDNAVHVAYHPMSEQVTRNESPVHRKLRTIINVKSTYMLGSLMQDLVALAISDKKERTSKSDYFDLFTALKDASKKTLESVNAIVNTLEVDGLEKRLVNFASKRVGKLDGKSYRRITIVTFPILDQFNPNMPADHIFDVKVSKKDKLVIFELLKFIISKLQVTDGYSAGSDSMEAPFFISLALAWSKFMEDVNSVSWRYKDALSNFAYCNTEVNYLDQLDKVSTFVGFIPSLEGNEGTTQLTNKSTGVTAEIGGLAAGNPMNTTTPIVSPLSAPMNNTPTSVMDNTTPSVPMVTDVGEGPLRRPNGPIAGLGGGVMGMGMNSTMGMGFGWGNQGMGWGGNTTNNSYLPPGTVMGKDGQPINIMTGPLDKLEEVLDPATFSAVYNQRSMNVSNGGGTSAWGGGMMGNAMGYGNNGMYSQGWGQNQQQGGFGQGMMGMGMGFGQRSW